MNPKNIEAAMNNMGKPSRGRQSMGSGVDRLFINAPPRRTSNEQSFNGSVAASVGKDQSSLKRYDTFLS